MALCTKAVFAILFIIVIIIIVIIISFRSNSTNINDVVLGFGRWSLVVAVSQVVTVVTDGQTDTRRQHIQRYMSTQSFVMHVMTFIVCHSLLNHILQ